MERLRQKRPRLVLEPEEYDQLKKRVLQRDGWKCQCCGSPKNFHVNHLVSRSPLGSDVIDNLMTLCASCHRQQHNKCVDSWSDVEPIRKIHRSPPSELEGRVSRRLSVGNNSN